METETKSNDNVITMMAKDAISAKLAQCYVTIGEKRYNFMSMTKFEAKFKKNKKKVAILGKTGSGNKAVGWEGSFTATMHYNTTVFRNMMEQFKSTGTDLYFLIQIINDDPTSDAGRQVIDFTGCNIDEGILAKFDATSEEPLSEDISGTFEDFFVYTPFTELPGMERKSE